MALVRFRPVDGRSSVGWPTRPDPTRTRPGRVRVRTRTLSVGRFVLSRTVGMIQALFMDRRAIAGPGWPMGAPQGVEDRSGL
ncbi:hypothetical protein Ga0074812_10810 [Parafrankia irregularis]|uniref:Uncharacterized protein n=1 Tax=Parafrankia irregularis TaxID=795642 RepID=A0A0S4QLT7_9ACTN|nr:hypothetical protein Ga0074812_10810 [Parafrankia irregularis]